MSAPWARDGEPDLACALALVGRKALGANRDGRTHITTSRVIVTWNHVEIGIGGEASITAEAMPAVLGQIGFVGAVVVQHGPLRMIERGAWAFHLSGGGTQAGSPADAPETSPGA